jgi:hypothetical protein
MLGINRAIILIDDLSVIIFMHRTNYTFPYSYLVTTSFQLRTHRRRLRIAAAKQTNYLRALKANPLPDRDGRFVQNSRTCSPQLG